MKTIFALTTGSQRSGVAVIRVSGVGALDSYEAFIGKKETLEPRKVYFRSFINPINKEILDKGLVVYFQAPNSFTGEDVIEYQIHGGRAVIQGFLNALSLIDDHRLAEPGEFTKRAFINGKMDLTEAEAIADLVDAETEAQRVQALEQLGGGLSKLYNEWAEVLKKSLAYQEAEIEFPEEDIPEQISEHILPEVSNLIKEIQNHLNDKRRGERLRNGILIAILGAPNAGKSTLLNTLAKRDAAIVSDEAGTTRDIIEVHLDLGGYPVILADTAGLRITDNKIEAEGIRRAENLSREADIKLALFDSTVKDKDSETLKMVDDKTIVVLTKNDKTIGISSSEEFFKISAETGDGIEELLNHLTSKISQTFGKKSGVSLTRERHRFALSETLEHLERSLKAPMPELAAEDLRMAMRSLGTITGIVHVEDLLDKIFKDFCIGK